ncbi:MAG: sensor histidine kinase [Nocardioidaceae bacterium]|nr:sensor histidine kinase [Nocardioidaceae bacterium]MCL2615058.1 sensor histidine kinase [Nocardioidaceae bacterium]
MPNNQAYAVLAAARLFALLAVAGPALWFRETDAVLVLLTIGVLWLYQGITATRRELELTLSPSVEAGAVGVLCALGMHYSSSTLAALVVPPLYAMLSAGTRQMYRVAAIQAVAVVSIGLMWWQTIGSDLGVSIFTWSMAGIGLSLIAGVTFAGDRAEADALRPYRDAQHLIRQLIDLSGNLSSGLDVTALGGELLSTVADHHPCRALYAFVPRGDGLTPVASTGEDDPETAGVCERLAAEAWARDEPMLERPAFAFLAGDHAVVAGVSSADETTLAELDLTRLDDDLASSSVRLDTALLFAHFRDAATADERQRLAREMHDGVAQDIASLGYIIDAAAGRATDPQQEKLLQMLRDQVTGVVAEVRRSVMNLRTSIGENESLGAAISAIARHLSEASGIPIRVRLDEQPARLRPEVEAELFRIAQEAMNNAVKHARANSIDVICQVYPPQARITVTDDGIGLQKGREDSHGLKIMRERAKLIGADLSVRDNASRGLTVSVALRSPVYSDR